MPQMRVLLELFISQELQIFLRYNRKLFTYVQRERGQFHDIRHTTLQIRYKNMNEQINENNSNI